MKKPNTPEQLSLKSTKEQILSAYNEVLVQLAEKQVTSPQEQKQRQDEQVVITKAVSNSSDAILTDLSALKSKIIKQIDNLSEQLLKESEKLVNLREAINLEQKHLQELYQINETANTLSALLQTQIGQKEQFKLEMEQTKQTFTQEMTAKKSQWQQQSEQLERDYKEQKEKLEKTKKREEEEYIYTLELKRRKEIDEYNSKKAIMEKELSDLRDNLLKREADLVEKEGDYESLEMQVGQIPNIIKEAVNNAEESLRGKLSQQYDFDMQLKQQEYEGKLKLQAQCISYLEDKITKQEILMKELTAKADMATQQIQSIACRALDTSAQRFVTLSTSNDKEKA
ncbi:hypothetical protein [Rickettsia endosymbiont of Culicoides newsteadi]|uniref:hypothetical protein n=1 Tax=Rickettsia endosymbiont of Culicoides newsteadi TaxID=1961830 RepID=UPI000B9B1BC6|nr:hypothetical protein [Rickettsia endosymbiont of Culicoides newsteadi]OZG32103.1 hypothetical protein RiCNE_04860 [Rickettsia endosymbiont of Culicoides newsteadi]